MDTEFTAGADTPAEGAARSATRKAAPWIEKFARFGYAAKGAVYILVGVMGIAAAISEGGQATGSSGALARIADSGLGQVALVLIAVGLTGYVVWGLVRATVDPEDDGVGHRIFYLITAVIYGILAVQAARLVLGGGGGGSSGGGASSWSAQLMQQPFGVWLVGLAGVAIGLYGVQQAWNAWRVDLDDHLDLASMSRTARTWTIRSGRLGLAARGVVFVIIGGYVVTAAVQADPSEARGLNGVLSMMEQTPWLLGLVALGLLGYGLYNLVRARYRIIRPA
jgi:hypothetical protein